MSKIGDINNYHDLTGLQNLKAQAQNDPESKEALKKAAQHFESIFIGMMLKSMRDANKAFEEGNPMHSNTTNFFRDMYDQQLATDMSDNGSMGLADIIVQQLSGDTESFKAASVLRNDATLSNMQRNNEGQTLSLNKTTSSESTNNTLNMSGLNVNGVRDASLNQNAILNHQRVSTDSTTANANPDTKPAKADMTFESPQDFVDKLWSFAQNTAKKVGLNPAVMVAQSALETGWGQHVIKDQNGQSSFNLFNVKAHRNWDGDKAAKSTLEFENGVAVKKVEPFRVYNSVQESFDDFVQFLNSNGRYEDALQSAPNPEQFLQKLQQAGYATDPNYADKIIGILKSDRFKDMINNVADEANLESGE